MEYSYAELRMRSVTMKKNRPARGRAQIKIVPLLAERLNNIQIMYVDRRLIIAKAFVHGFI